MALYEITPQLRLTMIEITELVEDIIDGNKPKNIKTYEYQYHENSVFISENIAKALFSIDIPVNKAIADPYFPFYVKLDDYMKWLDTHNMNTTLEYYAYNSKKYVDAVEFFEMGFTVQRGTKVILGMIKYVIANLGRNMSILIDIETGNRYTDIVELEDIRYINKENFMRLIDNDTETFEEIKIEV